MVLLASTSWLVSIFSSHFSLHLLYPFLPCATSPPPWPSSSPSRSAPRANRRDSSAVPTSNRPAAIRTLPTPTPPTTAPRFRGVQAVPRLHRAVAAAPTCLRASASPASRRRCPLPRRAAWAPGRRAVRPPRAARTRTAARPFSCARAADVLCCRRLRRRVGRRRRL